MKGFSPRGRTEPKNGNATAQDCMRLQIRKASQKTKANPAERVTKLLNRTMAMQHLNSVARAHKDQEVEKAFMSLIAPGIALSITIRLPDPLAWIRDMEMCLLAVAFVALFYSISLRDKSPKVANALGKLGMACFCIPMYMMVSSLLSAQEFIFIPILCGFATIGMCIYAALPTENED